MMVHLGWQLVAGASKLLSKRVVLWWVDMLLATESLRLDARACRQINKTLWFLVL